MGVTVYKQSNKDGLVNELSLKGANHMAKKRAEIEVSVAEVVDFLRITGAFAPVLQEVVARKITAQAARKSGLKVTASELQRTTNVFRITRDLSKARDTKAWLRANGISVEALEDYIGTNVLLTKFKDRLEKKTAKKKYLAAAQVKASVREMIYQDWLRQALK